MFLVWYRDNCIVHVLCYLQESSPLVKFDVPDDEVGGGETQISLEMRR